MADAKDEFFDAPDELGDEPSTRAATEPAEPALERDRRAEAEESEQEGAAGEDDEDTETIHGGVREQEEPAPERCYEVRPILLGGFDCHVGGGLAVARVRSRGGYLSAYTWGGSLHRASTACEKVVAGFTG